jgi:hypothetical protein
VLAWLAVAGILILFTLALTWMAVIPGFSARSADAAIAFSYPLIFLPFISSAFVPTETMPGPVRVFAEYQPVTSIVNAIRDLFHTTAGRPRHLDRPCLVCRHPHGRVSLRHDHLPPQDLLVGVQRVLALSCEAALPVRDRYHAAALCGKRFAVRVDEIDASKSGIEQPVP